MSVTAMKTYSHRKLLAPKREPELSLHMDRLWCGTVWHHALKSLTIKGHTISCNLHTSDSAVQMCSYARSSGGAKSGLGPALVGV